MFSSTLLYCDCRGNGQPTWLTSSGHRPRAGTQQLALASLSSGRDQLDPAIDQGLAPPAVASSLHLNQQQMQAIRACDESRRVIFLVFVGKNRPNIPGQI